MYYGNEVDFYQGKGIMHLFLTQATQIWDITPHIKVKFDSGMIRLYSSTNPIHGLVMEMQAKIGDVFTVKTTAGEAPNLEKINLPSRRGDKILWALGFTEADKRTSSYDEFVTLSQERIEAEFSSHATFVCTNKPFFAFYVSAVEFPRRLWYNF